MSLNFMENEAYDIRKTVNLYLSLIFKIGLVVVILSTFFLLTNLTTEMFDTPKFIILLIFTGILLIFLALKFTVSGKVVFVRTPLDIPLLLLLAVSIVGTILSPSPYIALLGNQLRIHGSLVSIVTYILFYFVLVNSIKNAREVKWIFTLALWASQVLAVLALVSYAGVKFMPAEWNQASNFTPIGSSFSATAILALFIPLIVTGILNSNKPLFLILNSAFLILSGITIALTGTWATWIAASAGLVLTVGLNNLRNLSHFKPLNLIALAAPLVIIALATALSFVPPVGETKNPIYSQAQNFPREIQLPFVDSWKISISAFRDLPFWGTGPSTYLFNFTNYKPVEFNSTKFWNLRFDSAFNEYLQVLATSGGVGLLALLSFTALFISIAYRTITRSASSQQPVGNSSLHTPLAISGIIFFIILILHVSTLPVWIIGLLILAAFMKINMGEGVQKSSGHTQNDFKTIFLKIATSVRATDSKEETIKVDALPGVILVIALAFVIFAGYMGGKFVLADYHHKLALNAVAQNQGIVAYNELIAAEKLNPYNDLYRTDLAQVNFALANAIAAAKGPTEASPSGTLTDQDKQNIQVLLQQSITEGRTAVTLSPKSAINWEILSLLYRQIAGVAENALVFSLDSYGRAIFQDPLNPQLRVNVGGVYYAIQNYDMAIRFFTDAINLKPDYANAYYNLSVTLRDKGDLNNAQAMAEKVLTLVDKDSSDYTVANDYLTELKSKIGSGDANSGNQTLPPAAETTGALQEEELPKVMNLPKPEKIATPEAIKKQTPTPTPTPTPTENPDNP